MISTAMDALHMERVPFGFMIAVVIAFVIAGLMNAMTDVPAVLIVIAVMGGLAAYLEYYFSAKE